jgi:hypothetical protein
MFALIIKFLFFKKSKKIILKNLTFKLESHLLKDCGIIKNNKNEIENNWKIKIIRKNYREKNFFFVLFIFYFL